MILLSVSFSGLGGLTRPLYLGGQTSPWDQGTTWVMISLVLLKVIKSLFHMVINMNPLLGCITYQKSHQSTILLTVVVRSGPCFRRSFLLCGAE